MTHRTELKIGTSSSWGPKPKGKTRGVPCLKLARWEPVQCTLKRRRWMEAGGFHPAEGEAEGDDHGFAGGVIGRAIGNRC